VGQGQEHLVHLRALSRPPHPGLLPRRVRLALHAPSSLHRAILTYTVPVLCPRTESCASHSSCCICLHAAVGAICLSTLALLYDSTLPMSTRPFQAAAWRQFLPSLSGSMSRSLPPASTSICAHAGPVSVVCMCAHISVRVCVCVCSFACMCECLYVCVYVCVCVCVCVCVFFFLCVYLCVCVFLVVFVSVCMCLCAFLCVSLRVRGQ